MIFVGMVVRVYNTRLKMLKHKWSESFKKTNESLHYHLTEKVFRTKLVLFYEVLEILLILLNKVSLYAFKFL